MLTFTVLVLRFGPTTPTWNELYAHSIVEDDKLFPADHFGRFKFVSTNILFHTDSNIEVGTVEKSTSQAFGALEPRTRFFPAFCMTLPLTHRTGKKAVGNTVRPAFYASDTTVRGPESGNSSDAGPFETP